MACQKYGPGTGSPSFQAVSDWTLQSPNGHIWQPSIADDGTNLQFTDLGPGTPTSPVPRFIDTNIAKAWLPTISDGGILTITEETNPHLPFAVVVSPNNTTYPLVVSSGVLCITDALNPYGLTKYCTGVSLIPYFAKLYTPYFAPIVTSWRLQSPNGTIWTPAIDDDGTDFRFTSGGSGPATDPVPRFRSDDSTKAWVPSISNDGVLSITEEANAGLPVAAVVSTPGAQHYWPVVNLSNIVELREPITYSTEVRVTRASIRVNFSNRPFHVGRVAAQCKPCSYVASTHYAFVDRDRLTRVSLRVNFSGGAFWLTRLRVVGKTKKKTQVG